MTDISGYYVGHLQEIIEEQRAEIERLQRHVTALSRTLNGIANRPDFADKVLAVADKAQAALKDTTP